MALSRKALEDILKSFEKSNRINKDAFAVQDERNRVNEHLANTPQEDERGILSKIYDTVNVLDSGRSWGTAQPTEEASRESGFNQAKRLGGTIFSGVEKVGDTAEELLGFTERRIRNLDRMLQEGSITREEYQRMLDKELKDTEWAGTEDKGLGDRTRRAGGVALEATSEILPFMKAGKAAQLTTKGGAAFGATEGLAHGVGSELTDPEGFSPKDVGLETVLAGLLGAGGGKFAQSRRAKADRAVESRYFDDIDAGADDVVEAARVDEQVASGRLLGDGTERLQRELDEVDAELEEIRLGRQDPNTYKDNPEDLRALAGEPVDEKSARVMGWNKNVEMVPTERLARYAEFDRKTSPIGKQNYEELKADIAENGIREPIILKYGANDRIAAIGEGNHRLAIAKELGIEEVPVEVTGTQLRKADQALDGRGFGEVPGRDPDQFGYVPSNQRPSEIGVEGRAEGGTVFAKDSPATIADSTETATRARALMRQRKQLQKDLQAQQGLDDIPDDIPPSRAADTDPTAAKAVENHKESVDNYFKSVDKEYSATLLDRLAPPMEVLKKMGLGKVVRVVRDGHDNMLRMEKAGRKMARNWAQLPGIGNDSSAKIFRSLDGKNVALNVDEKKVADEMRQFYKRMAEDLGLPEESKITDYVPHLFDNKNKNLDPELARIWRENPSGKVNSFFRKRRVNADGYIEDAFKVFDVYNRKAALDLHMSEPLKLMKEATPKLTDSSAKYINRQINIIKNTPEAQSQIMRELENLLKLPEGSATRGSAYARNLIYRGTLGLNPASALRNFSQSANTYSELGNRWTVYGGAKALNAMRKMDLDELIEANVLDDTFTRALRGGNTVRNKAAEIGDDTLWFMFQNVERFNRASAYYGAKGRALKRGLSEADAIKEGAEMARKTQFKFGEIDTPQALSGPIAKNLTQFMSFDVNQARFIKNMFAGSEGMIKKLPEGGYTFSPQGAAKVLRWMGFNAVFMASAGKAIGMDEKDFIPFWEDIMEKQPRTSPLVQLTVGDDSSVGLWNLAVGQDARGEEAPRGEIGKELIEDASGLFIPGGTQFHKTREGLDAVNQGASMTDSGQLRFLTGEEDRLQAGMFGQYSLPQAQEYIESDFELLSEPQTEKVMNLPAPERPQYVDFYKAKRGLPSQRTDVYAEIRKAKENGQIQRAQRLAEEWNNSLMDEFSEVLEKHNGLNDELLEELADLRVYVSNVRL